MFRWLCSFVFTVAAARWIYAEVKLAVPEAMPLIDYSLERLQIPTHDKWSKQALAEALEGAADFLKNPSLDELQLNTQEPFNVADYTSTEKVAQNIPALAERF